MKWFLCLCILVAHHHQRQLARYPYPSLKVCVSARDELNYGVPTQDAVWKCERFPT